MRNNSKSITNKHLGVENQFGEGLEKILLNVGDAEGGETGLVDSLHAVDHGEDVGGVGGVDVVLAPAPAVQTAVQAEGLHLRSQKGGPHDLPG